MGIPRPQISSSVVIYTPERLSLRNHVYIELNTYVGDGDVWLDDDVVIDPFFAVAAGDHTMKEILFRYGPYDYGKIHVDKGAWLGAYVAVTSNVTIRT